MSDMMFFPASWEDFLREYSFKDKEEIYTNGADLISVFRVRQMMEHYHHDWISVKDRLPEPSEKVLTYGVKTVTHWMPLPEPPESENDA